MQHLFLASAIAVASGLVTNAALAQSTAVAAPAAIDGDIVVTAQKRLQRTMDVPISVTAVSGATLSGLKITQSDQLASFTPGLAWGGTTGKSKPFIFLRGVGSEDYRSGSNSPVGTYTDSVYQGNNFGYGQLLLDLDRVEVLRGPQGTLWGKNTTGGVINYIPSVAKVGADTNGYADIGYGDYGSVKVNAAFGAPLSDKLAVRLAFGLDRDHGYFYSTNPATRGHVGQNHWYGIRGSLAFKPNDDLTIIGEVNYSKLDGGSGVAKSFGIFDPAAGAFSYVPCASSSAGRLGTSCGDVFGYVSSPDPYQVAPSSRSLERVSTFNPIVKIEWNIGDLTINSLTSYEHSSHDVHQDSDFTPSPLYEYNVQDIFRSYSQELRLSSPATRTISWILGAYAYNDRMKLYQGYSLPLFGNPQTGVVFNNKSQNYAVFADATYHITPQLNLTGGLRFTRDQRQADGLSFAFNAANDSFNTLAYALANITTVTGDFNPAKTRKDNDLSGRVVLDYHLTRNLMTYASFSRGFKGGDLNSGAMSLPEFFITGPEHLNAYQAGIKGAFLHGAVNFDSSAFFYDYQHAQVYTERGLITVLSNAGKLRIYGIDGNLDVTPVKRVSVNFGYSYLHSRYVTYSSDVLSEDYAGNRTPYASTVQLNGSIAYHVPLAEEQAIDAEIDASYRTKYYFTAANEQQLSQNAYATVNANLTYHVNKSLRASAWVKNITDKTYFVGGYSFAFIGAYFVLPGAPRTYGGSLRYEF